MNHADSIPLISKVISVFATVTFVLTSLAAGLLTICTSSLQYFGAFSRPSSFLTVDPARNLFVRCLTYLNDTIFYCSISHLFKILNVLSIMIFLYLMNYMPMQRILCHIQIFALSRWLAVELPVEFYEFAKNLQWTIPYFSLPWETKDMNLILEGSSPFGKSNPFTSKVPLTIPTMKLIDNLNKAASVYGSPLTSSEYQLYFEVRTLYLPFFFLNCYLPYLFINLSMFAENGLCN